MLVGTLLQWIHFCCGLLEVNLVCDATLFVGVFPPNRYLSHFLQMYSLDVGIENLIDRTSTTTVLPKFYFDSLKMIHVILVYQFCGNMYTGRICQCSTLGCIICRKIMLYCFQCEFYFHVHCPDCLVHDLHYTQTYQNSDKFGHCSCICHLSIVYDMVYI